MILSDGSTSLTLQGQEERYTPDILQTNKITAGGEIRYRTTGERLSISETIRVTATEYRALLTLLTNNAPTYFYTPEIIPALYNATDFPMEVYPRIGEITTRSSRNGEKIYYVSIDITSAEVFNFE